MDKKITPPSFNVKWKFPVSGIGRGKGDIHKSQEDFINEYFPSGHKIFNKLYHPDVPIIRKIITIDPNTRQQTTTYQKSLHKVNRSCVTYQQDAISIILAHLLGNPILLDNITPKKLSKADKEAYTRLNELCDMYGFDTAFYSWVKDTLICGHAGIVFYIKDGEVRHKILSYLNGDDLYCSYDKYGDPEKLFRKYSFKSLNEEGIEETRVLIDVHSEEGIATYDDSGEYISHEVYTLAGKPFWYMKRKSGAFWTPAQEIIDNHELMLSRLSEDNITKSKAKYVLSGVKTKNANGQQKANYHSEKIGDTDIFIGEELDLKMVQGASLSEAFKFEYETGKENIFNAMGIVYPVNKSSGDMPTGSMKMTFFPSERKCMELIHEYMDSLNQIYKIFRKTLIALNPNKGIDKIVVIPKIKLFTPQDETAKAEIINSGMNSGALSKEGARNTYPGAPRNNSELCQEEEEEQKETVEPIEIIETEETKNGGTS